MNEYMSDEELFENFHELETIGGSFHKSHTERLEGHQDFVSELTDETALRLSAVLTRKLDEDLYRWHLANTTNSYWSRAAIVADFCKTKANGGTKRFKETA